MLGQVHGGTSGLGLCWALVGLARKDVVVVSDYRRHGSDKELAADAHARGPAVLLFTDPWLSPVAGHTDVVLAQQVGSPSSYGSLVPTLATIEALVTGLPAALGESAYELDHVIQLRGSRRVPFDGVVGVDRAAE